MSPTSLDKSKIKFLLLEGLHPSALQVLQAAGYSQIESFSGALPQEELIARIADAHFIGIRSRTQLTAEVLEHAHKLVAIGCFCIGTNQVDLNAARDRGIAVFNAPYSNTRSVAELVLAEAILLLRGVPEKNAVAHRGGWLKTADNAFEVRGKTLGIIGYGAIGSQLSVLAEALGMQVLFHDVVAKLPLGNARQAAGLQELLAQSDIVTLHVPELPSTQWMIGAAEIAAMKPGAIFINASRGTVVEIEPLARALKERKLLGAAVDVFPVEPRISSVNFPEVALPAQRGKHRILHVHRNVPGVMSEINRVFSDNQINVSAQYLQTNEAIGYVVMDIDAESSELALQKLQQVPGTLRCRVLF